MADNVAVTAGTGTSIAADEVVDGTLGTVKVQYVKLMDGTLDSTAKIGGVNGLPTAGVYNSTAPTLTTGNPSVLQLDNAGRLLVNPAALTGTSDSVAINDGTNSASVQANDNGFNSLSVGTGRKEYAGLSVAATSGNFLVASTDVSAYKSLSLQTSGTWTGTVTFEASNDNSTWYSATLANISTLSTVGAGTQTTTGNSIYAGPIVFRYFRVRVSTTGTGTITGTLELSTIPTQTSIAAAASQAGTWTVASTVSAAASGGYSYAHYTGAQTGVAVKASAGTLHGILINTPVASGTLEYDDANSHTNAIGVITFPGTLVSDGPIFVGPLDLAFATGLNITSTGTMDFTIVFK